MDLSRVVTRDKLKPRREPYWHRLSRGRFIGFRPSQIGKSGTWIARAYDAAERRNQSHSLGDFGVLAANERFDAAKREAEAWCTHVGMGGSTKTITVRQACTAYSKIKPEAAGRFERYVYPEPIANMPLEKLAPHHIKAWRERLKGTPAKVSRRKKGAPVTRPRSAATLNRDLVPFRAALNAAFAAGDVSSNAAWREALKPTKGAGQQRTLYLDRTQRRALLAQLPSDARAFVGGLCALPLRPGALAALCVENFDKGVGVLSVPIDKGGKFRRIELPANTAAQFKEQARNKLPLAPLFTQANGKPWKKDDWKGPIKDAARAAGLSAAVTAYTLRHSTISDLVSEGLPLLPVAQIAGTSVRMIELHYGHLRQAQATAALAALAL